VILLNAQLSMDVHLLHLLNVKPQEHVLPLMKNVKPFTLILNYLIIAIYSNLSDVMMEHAKPINLNVLSIMDVVLIHLLNVWMVHVLIMLHYVYQFH